MFQASFQKTETLVMENYCPYASDFVTLLANCCSNTRVRALTPLHTQLALISVNKETKKQQSIWISQGLEICFCEIGGS